MAEFQYTAHIAVEGGDVLEIGGVKDAANSRDVYMFLLDRALKEGGFLQAHSIGPVVDGNVGHHTLPEDPPNAFENTAVFGEVKLEWPVAVPVPLAVKEA